MTKLLFSYLLLFGLQGSLNGQRIVYLDTLLPDDYVLQRISVVDSQTVWGIGYVPAIMKSDNYVNKIIKTTDGGLSWQRKEAPETKGEVASDIVGISSTEAWLATNSRKGGKIYKTINGGQDWEMVLTFPAGIFHLIFFDTVHIQCIGHKNIVARSSDRGASWTIDTIDGYRQREFNDLAKKPDPVEGRIWIATSEGRIIQFLNYGKDYQFIKPELISGDSVEDVFSVAFSDTTNGLMKYGTSQKFGKNDEQMARTIDGGLTWQTLKNQPHTMCYLLEHEYATKDVYWSWNDAGLDLSGRVGKTTDGGTSWSHTIATGKIDLIDSGAGGVWIAGRKSPQKQIEQVLTNLVKSLREFKYDSAIFINLFYTIEKCKALALVQAKRSAEALYWSQLPPELIHFEEDLRDSIAHLEVHRFNQTNGQSTGAMSALSDLKQKIDALRRTHDSLLYQLQVEYPEYYRRINDWQIANYQEYQQELLNPSQALIQYLVTDSMVFVTCVQKDTFFYQVIPKNFPLEQWVESLRNSLTAFYTDPNMTNQYGSLASAYVDVAHELYKKLFAPFADGLPEHLIIIPDGVLNYLPFEVLLTAPVAGLPTRWQQHPYLLQKHSISYAPSATMLREMIVHPHLREPEVSFCGFAPHYEGDDSLLNVLFAGTGVRKDLQPLPYTGEEVYQCAKIMDGQYFTGEQATEATFKVKAPLSRIIHLATHGQANSEASGGDYCFLVFEELKDSLENELLYARDIYNLQLNADLVTLSACETGIGELQGGEGIISLARAFAYAGAKSIVTSLWSVSDAKTKDLMVDFYKNLRRGALKDEALRQAKLDYLKRNKGQAAHPFFWASFVGIGDMAPVRK